MVFFGSTTGECKLRRCFRSSVYSGRGGSPAGAAKVGPQTGLRGGQPGQLEKQMIGLLTKVNIVDNSGALEGRCIRVYGYKKDKGGIGDTILLTITDIAKGSGTIKRGDKYKAAIVRVKKGARAKNPFITR